MKMCGDDEQSMTRNSVNRGRHEYSYKRQDPHSSRLSHRRFMRHASSRESPGSMIARSILDGSIRCRPRIIMAQMTTLLNVDIWPTRDVATSGWPSESPTLPLRRVSQKSGIKGGFGNLLRRGDLEQDCKDIEGLAEGGQSLESNAISGSTLTGSSWSIILPDSAMVMQKTPMNIYHRSKLSCLRICVRK